MRIFVVDDSAFVRKALTRVLASERGFHVVGEAASGAEALQRIPIAQPDLVTLDVAMKGMDGLQVLRALLRWKPTLKVIMLSAHTKEGAEATIEALAAGAADFIDKTTFSALDLDSLQKEVVNRLRVWLPNGADSRAVAGPKADAPVPETLDQLRRMELCVIGASTGGPAALQRILERVTAPLPFPVVIVQHMPAGFTKPFSQRLNALSGLEVAEAEDGERLLPGKALIAPAGRHLRITSNLAVTLSEQPVDAKHVPSIDVTMRTAARARPGRTLGVLLTGMGEDGADGLCQIRAGGGMTIAESEASCVVYGMPRAALLRGGATWMLPLPEISGVFEAITAASLEARGARR